MKRDPVKTCSTHMFSFALWLERCHPIVAEYRWPVLVEFDDDGECNIERLTCYVIGSRGRFVEFTPTENEWDMLAEIASEQCQQTKDEMQIDAWEARWEARP